MKARSRQLECFRPSNFLAGAGGLAIGLEKAGFEAVAFNELDKHACNTLRKNRPRWNIIERDIRSIDFAPFKEANSSASARLAIINYCEPESCVVIEALENTISRTNRNIF